MKKSETANKITRAFGMTGLKIKKHTPEALIVVGVVGVVASAVLACRATLKAKPIIDNAKKNMQLVDENAKRPEFIEAGLGEADKKKTKNIVKVKAGLQLAKEYAPAVTLGVVSITCILASNNILRKRSLALAAAYKTIDTSFKSYRNQVIERFGEELDKELKYGIKTVEVEEKVVGEDGKEQTVKKMVQTVDASALKDHSPFARIFDDGCNGWRKDPEHNLWTIRQIQAWANQRLKSQGYLFLNEVYEQFGFARTSIGQQVGWRYKTETGDGYVDFGIYDVNDPSKARFVNGWERNVIVDFNVDGVILDLI